MQGCDAKQAGRKQVAGVCELRAFAKNLGVFLTGCSERLKRNAVSPEGRRTQLVFPKRPCIQVVCPG